MSDILREALEVSLYKEMELESFGGGEPLDC